MRLVTIHPHNFLHKKQHTYTRNTYKNTRVYVKHKQKTHKCIHNNNEQKYTGAHHETHFKKYL